MSSHHGTRLSGLRKFWKPVVVTGAGSTSLVIWFEEIIAITAEFIGVIFLAVLGGLVCLFDDFIFKSRIPQQEDLKDIKNKGVKN